MIIDAHTHISNTEYGNITLYEECMVEAEIERAILFPGGTIDVRKMTQYITLKEKIPQVPIPNDLIYNLIHSNPERYYGFININPIGEKEKVLACLEKGVKEEKFVGLKLAPMVHEFSFTSSNVKALAELAGELRIPVYTHTLFTPGASTEKMGYLADLFPNTNFIIGHMGFGPADVDAIDIAKKYDNLFLETSGGSFIIIQQALQKVGSSKIIFGSEFPLQNPMVELTKIRCLKLKSTEEENILHNNILNLIRRKI